MSRWRDQLPVHPCADIFPLLDSAELKALADDIAENGIRQEIHLYRYPDDRLVLLDGRNRLDALELLGEEIFNKKGRPDVPDMHAQTGQHRSRRVRDRREHPPRHRQRNSRPI